MTSWAHYSEPTRPCTAITLLQGAKSIFTGMLMALEVSGAPHRVLLGPTESSNNSGSGDLTKHLSYFARGALQSSVSIQPAQDRNT